MSPQKFVNCLLLIRPLLPKATLLSGQISDVLRYLGTTKLSLSRKAHLSYKATFSLQKEYIKWELLYHSSHTNVILILPCLIKLVIDLWMFWVLFYRSFRNQ